MVKIVKGTDKPILARKPKVESDMAVRCKRIEMVLVVKSSH